MANNVTVDEMIEEISILAGIKRGQEDIAAGSVYAHEEVQSLINQYAFKRKSMI
jgi:predicted transcriptional regulator